MKPKIGLIGLTAEIYQQKLPELIEKLRSFSEEVRDVCESFAEVIHIPIVYSANQMEEASSRIAGEKCDAMVLLFLSYSPSLIIAPSLKNHPEIPVLLWNTQKLFSILSDFSSEDMFCNHGMHGVQDLASLLLRQGTKFSLITGYYQDQKTISEVSAWCELVAVARSLRLSRIGRIGGRFKDMGDFAVDDAEITRVFGAQVYDISNEDLIDVAKSVSNEDVREIVKEEKEIYCIDDRLDDESHFISARLEKTFRNIVRERALDALAVNFMGFDGTDYCEAIPFSALSKFMAEGIGYAGEGDALCAFSVLVCGRLFGSAVFTEMFTTDYHYNRIFMSHMGECNPLMAKEPWRIHLVKKELSLVKPGLGVTMLLFPLKPGKVTLFNIVPNTDGFHCIATRAEILDSPLFPDILSPHFLLKPGKKIEEFLTEYSQLGGTHHLAMSYGDNVGRLQAWAEMAGVKFYEL
ncbi:MAG: hypothetical protein WDA18_03545 [Candidatus Ratteibacteria bacterium]|jgi:L-arabinose isomerase